jgi:hypothetical protein
MNVVLGTKGPFYSFYSYGVQNVGVETSVVNIARVNESLSYEVAGAHPDPVS